MGLDSPTRFGRRVGAAVAVAALLVAGCGAGPSDRPDIAVEQQSSGTPGTDEKKPALPKPPALEVPKDDLAWTNCTDQTLAETGFGPGPQGLVLECSSYLGNIEMDDSSSPDIRLGVMRARLSQTPSDAAPIVVTTGSERSSINVLSAIAAGPVSNLLAAHPLVAVDRRGSGESGNNTCIDPQVARQIKDGAQFRNQAVPITEQMVLLSQQATTKCTDLLQPHELAADAAHAADDLELLRREWNIETIALAGLGNGARVALAYAAEYPSHLSRLILDSAEAIGTDAQTVAEARAAGLDKSIEAFSLRCKAIRCALGDDPREAILELLTSARNNDLSGVSSKAVLTAIRGFLGSPAGDQPSQVGEFAQTLKSAQDGDLAPLREAIRREEAINATDGQFMMRCTDAQQAPPASTVKNLMEQWGKKYPIGGQEIALDLLACAAWPTSPSITPVKDFRLPVLAMSSQSDPIVGSGGTPTLTGAITAAGGAAAEVIWYGSGHPVLAHSRCAQQAAVDYLRTGKLPGNGGVCPA